MCRPYRELLKNKKYKKYKIKREEDGERKRKERKKRNTCIHRKFKENYINGEKYY